MFLLGFKWTRNDLGFNVKRGSRWDSVNKRPSNSKLNGNWCLGRVAKRRLEEVKARTSEISPE